MANSQLRAKLQMVTGVPAQNRVSGECSAMGLRMPTEHGAWGMLTVPFLCAAAVARGWHLPLALAGACLLALFSLRGSMDAQGGWITWKAPAHIALALVALAAGGVLVFFYQRRELIALGFAAIVLFTIQEWLMARHKANHIEKRSLAAELVGVVLLSLAAPAAWIAARGHLEREGVEVWLLNLLFFLGGALYVKYRVRGLLAHDPFPRLRERFVFASPVLVYQFLLLALLASWTFVESRPAAMAVAFAPGALRACRLPFQLGQRFPIRRLGWAEVIHSVVFATLLVLIFRIK